MSVVNVDKMTYAASEDALEEARHDPRHLLVRADVADAAAMRQVFATHQPDAVMHLAAESHVDRSIDGPADVHPAPTWSAPSCCWRRRARYWAALAPARRAAFRFHHISTDEVFGALGPDDPPFTETTAVRSAQPVFRAARRRRTIWCAPGSTPTGCRPWSATPRNNYGPWQFPEKLIPLVTLNALEGKPLPVYGDGSNLRDWLFVEDHAEALVRVLERGEPGATYAIGARQPRSNLEVVRAICAASRPRACPTRPGRASG